MKDIISLYYIVVFLVVMAVGVALFARSAYALCMGEGVWPALLYLGAAFGASAETDSIFRKGNAWFQEKEL